MNKDQGKRTTKDIAGKISGEAGRAIGSKARNRRPGKQVCDKAQETGRGYIFPIHPGKTPNTIL
jgi:hypothetical protein